MPEDPITAREIGAALHELARLRHDHRNLRMVVQALEEELAQVRLAHTRLTTRLATIVAVGISVFALVTWLIEIWLR